MIERIAEAFNFHFLPDFRTILAHSTLYTPALAAKMKHLIVAALIAAAAAQQPCLQQTVPVNVGGQHQNWFVAMTGGANNGVSINNGVISMQHNYRACE